MRVWYIRDRNTKRVWSRNRLAMPTSIPDLYSSPKRARYQFTKGKIRRMTEQGVMVPEMVEAELKEIV